MFYIHAYTLFKNRFLDFDRYMIERPHIPILGTLFELLAHNNNIPIRES